MDMDENHIRSIAVVVIQVPKLVLWWKKAVVWSKREQIRNWPLHIMALLHSLYFIIKWLENRLLLAKLNAAFQRVGLILSILSHIHVSSMKTQLVK